LVEVELVDKVHIKEEDIIGEVEVQEVTLEMEDLLEQVIIVIVISLELPIMVMMVLAVVLAVVDIQVDLDLVVEAVESVFLERDLVVLEVKVEALPL
jgi:hypothetical protein